MASVANDFWGKVLRRTTKGVRDTSPVWILPFGPSLAFGRVGRRRQVLCESEVDELQVAIGVQEYILRFEISVSNVLHVVEVCQDECNFGSVELDSGNGKSAGAPKVREDLSTGSVFEL